MANNIVIIILLLLSFLCFFRFIRSSINLTVVMIRKSDDENRAKLMEEYLVHMAKNMITMIILSGCISYFLENVITGTLIFTLIVTYITLCFIICMHEFGHYFFAKKYGLRIGAFSVGIGPTLYKAKIKETIFTLKLFPLLGFVKPADISEFIHLKSRQKIMFFTGGLIVNYLFYVLGVVMVMIGKGYSVLYGIKSSFTLLWTSVLKLIDSFSWGFVYSSEMGFEGQVQAMFNFSEYFTDFWIGFTLLNMILLIFNLIPISPLDGGHIFKEILEKTLYILRIPKKIINFIITLFVVSGIIFFTSRAVVNNGWAMFIDLRGRWIEFTLWTLLFVSVIGFFSQRIIDKTKT